MNQKHIFLERVFFDFFLLFVSDKLGELTLGQCIYFLCMKTTLWSEHVPGIQNYSFSWNAAENNKQIYFNLCSGMLLVGANSSESVFIFWQH